MGLLSHRVERSEMKPGDHIYTWRAGYTYSHHGTTRSSSSSGLQSLHLAFPFRPRGTPEWLNGALMPPSRSAFSFSGRVVGTQLGSEKVWRLRRILVSAVVGLVLHFPGAQAERCKSARA
jgi:hypothetical protein